MEMNHNSPNYATLTLISLNTQNGHTNLMCKMEAGKVKVTINGHTLVPNFKIGIVEIDQAALLLLSIKI
jgi:hypothetical protein